MRAKGTCRAHATTESERAARHRAWLFLSKNGVCGDPSVASVCGDPNVASALSKRWLAARSSSSLTVTLMDKLTERLMAYSGPLSWNRAGPTACSVSARTAQTRT